MPKLILPKEAARQVVSSGTKASGKSIQTFKRSIPSEEESIVLIRVSSEWTVLSTGGYRATGVMIGASGNVRSGEVFVYAPTAASADGLPLSGKRIHAARVNGRWEMIQSGSGGAVDLYAGEGISIDEPEYTITNTGVLSVSVVVQNPVEVTGRIGLDYDFFYMDAPSNKNILLDYRKVRGKINVEATSGTQENEGIIQLRFSIVDL